MKMRKGHVLHGSISCFSLRSHLFYYCLRLFWTECGSLMYGISERLCMLKGTISFSSAYSPRWGLSLAADSDVVSSDSYGNVSRYVPAPNGRAYLQISPSLVTQWLFWLSFTGLDSHGACYGNGSRSEYPRSCTNFEAGAWKGHQGLSNGSEQVGDFVKDKEAFDFKHTHECDHLKWFHKSPRPFRA
jgi:hypothetical protein